MPKADLFTWAATKILSTLADVYGLQCTTPRTSIYYQLQCTLLPIHFSLYMLELKGRWWTSRQKSPASGAEHNGQNDKTKASSAGVLTGKNKSSRQPNTTSMPIGEKLLGKESIVTAGWATSTGWTVNLANACRWRIAISWAKIWMRIRKWQDTNFKYKALAEKREKS